MLHDLKIAMKRMEQDPPPARSEAAVPDAAEADDVGPQPAAEDVRPSVMIVESNHDMQNVFRNAFKRAGYRVLITSDPGHALSRFQRDISTADCLVLNAQELGKAALAAFNDFAADDATKAVPAVLLLGENQKAWSRRAKANSHRVVLAMPITMKQLRGVLAKLAVKAPAEA
jgi:serine/threonine-protein kinase